MFGKTQSKEVTIDPVRAALAAAIVQRDAAQRKVDAAKASVERASALVEAAEGRCAAAVAALATRRKEGAQRVLEMATTGAAGMPDVSTREASQADLDAAEGLLAAKDALATCVAHLKDPEADLRHAEWHVERALSPVLAAEADRVLAETERLKDELEGARAVLAFLQSSLEPGSPLQRKVMFALPATPPGEREVDLRQHPALAPWRDAREALTRDADAPLPR
jgi:hypothetical protein